MTNPVRTAIVTIEQGKPMCSSRHVAAVFGKRHADVLRDVDHLIEQAPEAERNFALCPYSSSGRAAPTAP
jgi:phage regulator Rha-like protein